MALRKEKTGKEPVRILSGLRHQIINSYDKLAKACEGIKEIGATIVLTIGTWDETHIGHCRYLAKAREFGNVLVVGVDTDRAVKLYKGEDRPIVPFDERAEMITHLRYADFVTHIDDVEINQGDKKPYWKYGLLKAIKPDIFVAVEDSYPDSQLGDIRRWCGEIIILPRQAETSTSAIVRKKLIAENKTRFRKIKAQKRKKG